MAVHATITIELAIAVGRIAEVHRKDDDAAIMIDYRDHDPESRWTVTVDQIDDEVIYVVDDETGYIDPPLS